MSDLSPVEPELVQKFVRVAHGDLAQVTALLEREPSLVNAAWDWGGGDWETALGAASHTGGREIAGYLLAHGARMDVFCAAMLGKLSLVRALVQDHPALLASKGPHGIPLMVHAEVGGEEAANVVEYLRSLADW